MSMTYNANDESFSNNASGISLEFKMQNPRNLAQAKARSLKAYAQMYKMIFHCLRMYLLIKRKNGLI